MGLRYVFTGSMQGYRNVMNVAASCVVRLTGILYRKCVFWVNPFTP